MSRAVTSVESDEIVIPDVMPYPTQDLIRQQQRDLLRNPERREPPVELNRTERYIFRSHPGTHRAITHTIDVRPEVYADDHTPAGKRQAFELRRWLHRHRGDPGAAELLATVAEHNNGPTVVFHPTARGRFECYMATEDPVVAAYVRELMDRKIGEFAAVYEESGHTRILVGGHSFPNNDIGWRTAKALATKTGGAITVSTEG